jgi:phenylalanine-4-hydroxylase
MTTYKTTYSKVQSNIFKGGQMLASNPATQVLPPHLKKYVVEQDYSRYTYKDQAVWRYIMRQLTSYLKKHAHPLYIEGLAKTGISTETIPSIDEMSQHLAEYGWTAVPVSGFIPPAAFMELQSLGILPIASDIRSADHVLYTPAPDIVHEAAGHAPILIDQEYAQYLKNYADVAKKAIMSKEDLAQYEAIRVLSDIKEDPNATVEDIKLAEKKLDEINASITEVSEAGWLSRMNWWTAEYGLIGNLENPKIFGAGLLSSIGEARSCLKDDVKKIPLSVECITQTYDITEPQPQLFVTPSFERLSEVLEDLANKMAFRMGGATGLQRAIDARSVNTVELNTGIQISGQFVEMKNKDEEVFFVKASGPCQLSVANHEVEGQGTERHAHGYSCPVGKIIGHEEGLSVEDTRLWETQESVTLVYESGIQLEGKLTYTAVANGAPAVLTFKDCSVTYKDEILFDPSWGEFDLAIGQSVTSVYGGPADRNSYGETEDFVAKVIPRKSLTEKEQKLDDLYSQLREIRESANFDASALSAMVETLDTDFPKEWLIRIELMELAIEAKLTGDWVIKTQGTLEKMIQENFYPNRIKDGLKVANEMRESH